MNESSKISFYLCVRVCMYVCMYVFIYVHLLLRLIGTFFLLIEHRRHQLCQQDLKCMYVCLYVCMYVCIFVLYVYVVLARGGLEQAGQDRLHPTEESGGHVRGGQSLAGDECEARSGGGIQVITISSHTHTLTYVHVHTYSILYIYTRIHKHTYTHSFIHTFQ